MGFNNERVERIQATRFICSCCGRTATIGWRVIGELYDYEACYCLSCFVKEKNFERSDFHCHL